MVAEGIDLGVLSVDVQPRKWMSDLQTVYAQVIVFVRQHRLSLQHREAEVNSESLGPMVEMNYELHLKLSQRQTSGHRKKKYASELDGFGSYK